MAITLDGTSGITSAGTIADATAVVRPLVSGTSVASTSGTSIDFGICNSTVLYIVSCNCIVLD